VLILCHPGLTASAAGATPTIAAAYQMLFPGEKAPVHAHSISAIRFGLAGSGARMIIDGDRAPMEPGDLILTPSWSWHGHGHPGGDEPVVWMDGLDVVVARGTGTLICGGQTFPLSPNDVAAIPAWTWHQLTASDTELVLLRLTDRPIHDAFGQFQAEEQA
jgi:gentisate 1,2-dioxygenase